jgi:site-specific DNA-methyltransferase (adenine-specific)
VLFKSASGAGADASIEAFDDTWTWGDSAKEALLDIAKGTNRPLQVMMDAMRSGIGENPLMAYLAMMAVRLVELHRVLKDTGSLYLHCDPTASHYLKLVLDAVFGAENYRNEIVWKRTSAHGNVSANYGDVTDSIFYYSKGRNPTWNKPMMPLSEKHVEAKYSSVDETGRRYTTRDMRNPGVRPNLHYEYTALNGVTYQPHPNGWTCTKEKMRQYDEAGLLYYPKEKVAGCG